MKWAIKLDDQFSFETNEIGDVRTDRHLTFEFVPVELAIARKIPENFLGLYGFGAHNLGAFAVRVKLLAMFFGGFFDHSLKSLPLPLRGRGSG